MANPLHIKGSRTKVLNTLPKKELGSDGDIVISRIKGKGVYLCTKAGGMWYVATQLQELNKIDKSVNRILNTNKLNVSGLIDASKDTDKHLVSDKGRIKYRTTDELSDDLGVPIKSIDYKQAYCSLGQYTNKEDCEVNNGTWYYSDNDSHDSISSTAENELLTVASSLNKLDAEPTLLYDGSTLEIKRNTDFDDNWQTSTQDSLLKLSYDSSNSAIFDVSSTGELTLDVVGDITLNADGGQVSIKDDSATHFEFNCDSTSLRIYDDANANDYLTIYIGDNGESTITTNDNDGAAGHLVLQPDGNNQLICTDGAEGVAIINSEDREYIGVGVRLESGDSTKMRLYESGGDSQADYLEFKVEEHGASTISTVDAAAAAANLILNVDGNIELNADGGDIGFKDDSVQVAKISAGINNAFYLYHTLDVADLFSITIAASGATTIATVDDGAAIGHLTLAPDGDLVLDPVNKKTIINAADTLYFDGGTHTFIRETSDDVLDVTVGNLKMMTLDEGNTKVEVLGADLEIDSGKRLYLDGGGDTYISESSADVLDIKVGDDVIFQITESGDDGNTIDIDNACIGFTQVEPTYDATDTVVDFRHSNKQFLTFGIGGIVNLKLYFPLVSGNFVLLLKQNPVGSCAITNYRAYEFDESTADGATAVKWAGGSNPTLTTDANHVDILSFYWDADNEIAYGVATLDFQD